MSPNERGKKGGTHEVSGMRCCNYFRELSVQVYTLKKVEKFPQGNFSSFLETKIKGGKRVKLTLISRGGITQW